MRDRTYETIIRSASLRANALFQVGTVSGGGERHLIDTGAGVITSQRFGGQVGLGDTVLVRNDSGQSFFY
jgi:thymidine phosphorylase